MWNAAFGFNKRNNVALMAMALSIALRALGCVEVIGLIGLHRTA